MTDNTDNTDQTVLQTVASHTVRVVFDDTLLYQIHHNIVGSWLLNIDTLIPSVVVLLISKVK